MKQTKASQIIDSILRQIERQVFKPGDRVPSLRQAALDYGVSKNTVVEAYDRLVAKGALVVRQGAGFVVAKQRDDKPADKPGHIREAGDIASLLRAQLDRDFAVRAGDGRPPPSWTEGVVAERQAKLLRTEATQRRDNSGYGSPLGHQPFRDAIAERHQQEGFDISPDQIVTTFGANHALDLIIRRFLQPGDIVLVDDPGYYPLFAKLAFAQVQVEGVKRTPNGPDVAELTAKAQRYRPKLFFTQSLAQNPTGTSYDLPTAHQVLKTAAAHNFLIVDDDPFIDLPNVNGVRLASLDMFQSVLFVGTFSKTLSASFRSGYIIARKDLIDALAELKLISCVNSSRYSEIMITDVLNSRRYQRHVRRLSDRVSDAVHHVQQRLAAIGFTCFGTPANGYYLMAPLPEGFDDIALARAASAKDIFLAPISLFSTGAQPIPGLRINVTRADDSRLYRFLQTAL